MRRFRSCFQQSRCGVSDRRSILIQLDSDPHPSVFDRVVAIDAGADEVFSYGNVQLDQVRNLVHGAIFTRGPKHLKRTALFVGGSNVAIGERLMDEACKHMLPQFGLQVSVLLDANGANTTAAAAVHAAAQQVPLAGATAVVLGATGPVGQRVVRLLAREGAKVRVVSRQRERAQAICDAVRARYASASVEAAAPATALDLQEALTDRAIVIAAGAAGVVLLPRSVRLARSTLKVAIDLNAVPPLGIEGVEVTDKAVNRDGVICYGAIGVGDTKMKIHKAAITRLFESNDQRLDAEEVYALATKITG